MTFDKTQIVELLQEKHRLFSALIVSLSADQLMKSNDGKWNAAQLIDHIIKSVSPVKLAFSMPLFVLKLVFGRANRPSRGYDELVAKYQSKLQAGGKAPKRFWPKASLAVNQQATVLDQNIVALCAQVESLTETQLDRYLLPHPLLGKITLREMLYFTIYHVQHHQQQVSANLYTK